MFSVFETRHVVITSIYNMGQKGTQGYMFQQHIEQDSFIFTFCFLTEVFFNIWNRVSDISHVFFSFFIRLLFLILFSELLTSTSFIAKGLCSILLFLPMYNLSLSTKTTICNWSVGIQEKCFLGMCSSLYATHTEQKQKKKPKKTMSMTVFSLDSLVSGVLFHFEMKS